jgi:hypothetical protein
MGDEAVVEGLQVPVPMALCISPGFAWPHEVVGARTQPLDSCIITASMYSWEEGLV